MILGGAISVWDEYARVAPEIGRHAAIVVNDAGTLFPEPVLAWATLHPEKLGLWRRRRQGPKPFYTVSPDRHHDDGGITHLVREKWGGSSGLYAVQIAIELFGFDRIVLCGVPITGSAGHIRGVDHWDYEHSYQSGWLRAHPHIGDRVRSCSGWTRGLLGPPDRSWLHT